MPLRSPCYDCAKLEDEKRDDEECANCKKRIAYVESMDSCPLGPIPDITIDPHVRKQYDALELLELPIITPRYCLEEGCEELYYAKGYCQRHYDHYRRYALGHATYEKGKTVTIDFRGVPGGMELNMLIRAISKYERRAVRTQALILLQSGAHKWLKDHDLD